MPHFPKPFFREPRGLWYVQIDGKQYNLGPDEKQAFERYHDLMRNRPSEKDDVSLALGVIDAFLQWAKTIKLRERMSGTSGTCNLSPKPCRLSCR